MNSVTDTPGAFIFTVIGNVPDRVEDVTPVRVLLDAIDTEHLTFVVCLDSLKGRDEACSDTLPEACHDLLDSLIAPVIYTPGDHDRSDCQRPAMGSFDPVERLLHLCELFYPNDSTLSQRIMTVMRQSGQAKFRSYCESTRWAINDVLFTALNVSGGNNNYKTAGGRSGEYEDRLEANRQWLACAFTVTHQRKMTDVVVMVQVDPLFEDGWERCCAPNLFNGLLRRRSHDDHLALKRQMRLFTCGYDGAVLLVYGASQTFILDRPSKDEDGHPDAHVMCVRIYGSPVLDRWLEVSVTPGHAPLFYIRSYRLDSTSAPTPKITPAPAQQKMGAKAPVLVSR